MRSQRLRFDVLIACVLFFTLSTGECSPATRAAMGTAASKGPSTRPGHEPVEYVLQKFQTHDLVMIGERHWTHEEPVFIQNLIRRCCERKLLKYVFLEFGRFEDQGKIDRFLQARTYDPTPVIETLRNNTLMGWGYQEYFDIFRIVYEENRGRPVEERMQIILVDASLDFLNVDDRLFGYLKESPLTEQQRWAKVSWLRESITDRDRFMAEVIAMFEVQATAKGLYYAGSSHIRKDLQRKNYGRRYFAAGGVLSRLYPGRVSCLTFHLEKRFWQDAEEFALVEGLGGAGFAMDASDPRIRRLKLRSDMAAEGVALEEAFDGYIFLNKDGDYRGCNFVPGFYTDAYVKTIWDTLRKQGMLDRLPPELQRWKDKTPTGEEFMQLMKDGLH